MCTISEIPTSVKMRDAADRAARDSVTALLVMQARRNYRRKLTLHGESGSAKKKN